MATEKVTVLKVIADDAVRTVADLKNNVAAYKQVINEATIGSEEYTQAVAGLAKTQNMLKDAMYLTNTAGQEQGDVMQGLSNAAEGMGESYNSLVHRMAALKSELRATDVSTEEGKAKFAALAEQINATNDKLKAMDAAQGNHQRNVGNYKSAIEGLAGSFQATAGGAGAVINPLKNMKMGLTAISATPAVAILGLLANIILKVTSNLKSNEAVMNRVKMAFAAFNVLGDLSVKVMQKLGEGVAWVSEKIAEFAEKIFGVTDAQKEHKKITEEEIQLQQQQRKHITENADLELQISQLRAQAAQKDKVSAKERIALLQEAAELEKKISENAVADAQLEYDIIKRRNALTESSTEEKDKEAQAYAKMINAQKAYFDKTRELNAQIAEAKNAMKSTDAKAADAVEKENAKAIEAQQKLLDRLNDLTKSKYEKDLSDLDKKFESEYAALEGNYDAQLLLEEEYNLRRAEIEAKYTQERINNINTTASKEYEANWELTQEKVKLEQEYIAKKKALQQTQMQMGLQLAGNMSSILGSIADLYEADDANAEKNAKKIKVLRIASATIDTITGAIGAYMACQRIEYGIMGPILGAINAATVVAAGIANIAKIKATKVGSGGDASSGVATPSLTTAAVSAPTYTPEIQQTTIATGASQEQTLNTIAQDQKVYILSSDLEADENARKVQVADTSF